MSLYLLDGKNVSLEPLKSFNTRSKLRESLETDLMIAMTSNMDLRLTGLPPWTIRNSEIYHVPFATYLDKFDVNQALWRFSQSQQRFGK